MIHSDLIMFVEFFPHYNIVHISWENGLQAVNGIENILVIVEAIAVRS